MFEPEIDIDDSNDEIVEVENPDFCIADYPTTEVQDDEE